MSLTDKLRIGMGEPEVACPACETKTPVSDLLSHVQDRCPGPGRSPDHARWLNGRQLAELVPRGARARRRSRTDERQLALFDGAAPDARPARVPAPVTGWLARGIIRTRGTGDGTEYLMRDVVRRLAESWITRRRRHGR